MTMEATLPAGPARNDLIMAKIRRRTIFTVAMPLLVLAYLVYAWNAFGIGDVLGKAKPENAKLIALDTVAYKTQVEKNFRRGGLSISIEGERAATYKDGGEPLWIHREPDDNAEVDLGEGYLVEITGKTALFTVPGYGVIKATATDKGVDAVLPSGPVPDWLRVHPTKIDARPTFDRRLQVTKTKIEVHRYSFGWETFWFTFDSPLHGKSLSELWSLALSSDRIDPDMSNAAFILDQFLNNQKWQHGEVFKALLETVMMGVLGTFTAALAALPLAFLAARTFCKSATIRFFVRRVFDFVRGIDMLIWSLIFIRAFGLGPLTGALAIAFTDTGSLGKLFSEALENIDNKQVEGIRSTGANQVQRYRFGVIPQILPVFVSQVLYFTESNMRSATVIGALGAGGIGLILVEAMRTSRSWENVSYIIVLTIILVVVMDQLSSWLRRKLIEGDKH